ncbi:glycine oxidase ThiO [Kineosporia sp. J2-2]|uniref:glycine oxidase n=1 Tax=Kineosporia corallincola TaxID=2835133 RepID=A0ABS5TBH3_9ACTN|nr:glycine oxidase ThiO [Kineosporia corallincola]MBT0768422.1 glycine oxidase ThiO [Kineosporia corallincola]
MNSTVMQGNSGSPDVIVLGGGIIGLSSAWSLARAGLRVVVVDPAGAVARPRPGATWAAAGMLAPVSEASLAHEPLTRLGTAAVQRFPDLVESIRQAGGPDPQWRRTGSVAVAYDSADRDELRRRHDVQHRWGLDARMLEADECRDLEPALDPGVAGGVLIPDDHQVNPRRLVAGLLHMLTRVAGVEVIARAGRPQLVGGRVEGVRLDDGQMRSAPVVVLATGAWSSDVCPVRPVKGQILRLRMSARDALLRHPVRGIVAGREVYLVPRADGELVVGATTEDVGLDESVTAAGVYELLRDAITLVPGIQDLELTETLARCRPASPDGLPLIGRCHVPGLVLATGHGRHGVLLSALTGDAVRDAVLGRPQDDAVTACDPGRFTDPVTLEGRAA